MWGQERVSVSGEGDASLMLFTAFMGVFSIGQSALAHVLVLQLINTHTGAHKHTHTHTTGAPGGAHAPRCCEGIKMRGIRSRGQ